MNVCPKIPARDKKGERQQQRFLKAALKVAKARELTGPIRNVLHLLTVVDATENGALVH